LIGYFWRTAGGDSIGMGFSGPASYFFKINLLALGENF